MNDLKSPKIWLAGIQWMFYIFMNTVVIPLSLSEAFQLTPADTTSMMLSSFVLTGTACMLQALIGHRYALMDGQSGIGWGLTLGMCAAAPSIGLGLPELGGSLAAGFLLSGIMTLVLGAAGFAGALKKLFNPVVIGVTLFLLTFQLVMHFFEGMFVRNASGEMNLPITGLTVGIALLVGVLQVKGRGIIGSFALLIGIVAGWAVYALFFQEAPAPKTESAALFSLLPWGPMRLDAGIMLTAAVVGLINMASTVSALSAAETLYGKKTSDAEYKRSFALSGLFTSASSFIGVLPFGVYASSIGFLEGTRILKRSALVIGGAAIAAFGLFPAVGSFFARLPIAIGSAVLFVAYLQMFGTAFRMVQGIRFNARTIFRIALPLLLGVSLMNADAQLFLSLPIYIQPLISNGLVMGVLVSILLESAVPWSKYGETQPDEADASARHPVNSTAADPHPERMV